MRLEYRKWIDSIGGPGYVLKEKTRHPYLFNGKIYDYFVYEKKEEGNKAWAKRVAKHYGIEMPEEKQ